MSSTPAEDGSTAAAAGVASLDIAGDDATRARVVVGDAEAAEKSSSPADEDPIGDASSDPSSASARDAPAPKPLTAEQKEKIFAQVEFYFSDANLPTDAFLMKKVRAGGDEGWVPLDVICSFNRMKQLLKKRPHSVVCDVLAELGSALLVSDDAKTAVRRVAPLPDVDLEEVQSRTVLAENFPGVNAGEAPTIEAVRELFASAGEVLVVRVRHPGMTQPAGVAAAKSSGLDLIQTPNAHVHALVEFKTAEEALRAVTTLNNDRDWRNGLRVRSLVRPGAKKKKAQKEKAAAARAAAADDGGDDGGGEGDGGEDGATAEGGDATAEGESKTKKKKKYGRQKRDYSQWASAAAFKENKTSFLESGEGDAGGGGGGREGEGESTGGGGGGADAAAPPSAQPTMPDGTRGFTGAGRGRRMPPPPPP
jgi:La-related protein 7